MEDDEEDEMPEQPELGRKVKPKRLAGVAPPRVGASQAITLNPEKLKRAMDSVIEALDLSEQKAEFNFENLDQWV
eukprot:2128985-Alexandrium_andersonii.AAC.1